VALYIYRVERSCPARKSFYKPKSIRTPFYGSDRGAPVRPVRCTYQTGVLGVQILYKSYLPHPDSDLDVAHMNLDLLDGTYPMVKSKLYFMVFNHTSLTGGTHRSDRSDKTCQFWVRTNGMSSLREVTFLFQIRMCFIHVVDLCRSFCESWRVLLL
jgi:hypothetical protein